jgi:hypothetical protein
MITLESYPVYTESGVVYDIFPGFKQIIVEFKREDVQISTVTAGSGGKILVTVPGDITGDLNENEDVYIYSEGINYTYDDSGEATSISFSGGSTTFEVDIDYIESTTSGYCNYFQNYNVELQLVDPDNFNINLLGFTLQNDGTDSGIVKIDTSIINDTNTQEYLEESGVVENGRVKYNIKYRESYRDNTGQTWIEVDNPIIAVFATENVTIEGFSSPFDVFKTWVGYPNNAGLFHSDANQSGKSVQIVFDELDINQNVLTSDNQLKTFNSTDYGLFLVTDPYPSFTFDADTNYALLKASYVDAGEFNASQFNKSEFNV